MKNKTFHLALVFFLPFVIAFAFNQPATDNCEYNEYLQAVYDWQTAVQYNDATGRHHEMSDGSGSVIFVSTEASALHEVGHFVDADNGMISDTPEFQKIATTFIENNPGFHPQWEKDLENDAFNEIFADIYRWLLLAPEGVPVEFLPFFDNSIISLYN